MIINNHKSCQKYMMSCMIITVVGVVSIGALCAVATYLMILKTAALSDPTSPTFIAEPLAVAAFAFCLCGSIAYGFMMLFDHTADTLLYCYAWNKKFNKETVELFMPESLRDLVGHIVDKEDGYQFFGNARPEMYLATWLPKKYSSQRGKQAKQEQRRQQVLPAEQQQRTEASFQGPAFSRGGYDTTGQYAGSGYFPPEQQQPDAYYHTGPMYTGGAYDASGRYIGAG